jgi:hypothetical protein
MSWWWEFFEDRGMNTFFQSVREISDEMLSSGNGSFENIPVQADSLDAYSVKCGNKIFVYLYNKAKSTIKPDLVIRENETDKYKVQSYSTLSREYKDLGNPVYTSSGMNIKGLSLNPKSEIVLILTSERKAKSK